MHAELIDIREAWKSYHIEEVEIPAVRGVSLVIPAGQFVAITGASGSGKSTFMHVLGCLDRLDRGQYFFEGQPIERYSRRQLAQLRNRRIGFVFQSFNLLARTSIVDNVALPLAYQGVRRGARRRQAAEMLERVGLGDRLKHHPNQLSGGQQQRVALARALVTRPAVVLADEPTGNLDTATSQEIMRLLQAMNRDEGVSIVLVTHEPDIAAYAQRQVVFRDGQVVRDTAAGSQAA
ncbi:MAG TPA: ABC transporter ATP-binding protein [Phycisphaerae bacterium]|jgi:putative ABC transport system ATP-binding protein|nr:ABC transporter ATP-binding protein [Phycisphaerae bacterium]HPC23539.1 ABC transporter ATP-binding protein [Phycisphaerae bacterium]HRT43483.1 ABC transporter ATP-binding protein [Phycisphaerae bacterium]